MRRQKRLKKHDDNIFKPYEYHILDDIEEEFVVIDNKKPIKDMMLKEISLKSVKITDIGTDRNNIPEFRQIVLKKTVVNNVPRIYSPRHPVLNDIYRRPKLV